ncbi:hypothetical protein Pmani_012727 [Petrolisthes manimaculis]|uniref:Uncharacterized protein n=1 Tax=Petrolisthes manimaculis TaxID=1843537 RepID=A0AAE1UA00_9EUCA|nr:hypothetical protein Pmani_012727 [Petrolisthes manimaculis]
MESEVYKVPEDALQIQERLAKNKAISVFMIPQSKSKRKRQTNVRRAHSREDHLISELTLADQSENNWEEFTLHDGLASNKPKVETGQASSSNKYPDGMVKGGLAIRASSHSHKWNTCTIEPNPGLHSLDDSRDSLTFVSTVSDSSTGCNQTSGTLNPRKLIGAHKEYNALQDTPQSQSAHQVFPENAYPAGQSSLEYHINKENEFSAQPSDNQHGLLPRQKYNLKEVIHVPVSFSSACPKDTNDNSCAQQNNMKKNVCTNISIKITLPKLNDESGDRIAGVFCELGKLLNCTVAVEKNASYTIQQEPSEKFQGKTWQSTGWACSHPQLPYTLGHILHQNCDRSDREWSLPKTCNTTPSINGMKRRKPMHSVTKKKCPVKVHTSD